MDLNTVVNARRNHGIILDTNLLLLHAVHTFDPASVTTFKKTKVYTSDVALALDIVVQEIKKIVCTPAVLSEFWNHAEQYPSAKRASFLLHCQKKILTLVEVVNLKEEIATHNNFIKLGYSDVSLIMASRTKNFPIFTSDLRAYIEFQTLEIPSLNVNHLLEIS